LARLNKFDFWQIKELLYIIYKKKICLNRCRGASKTRDMSVLYVFFCIRFGGDLVYWLASSSTQLEALMKYLKSNPFVVNFNINVQTRTVKLINNDVCNFAIIDAKTIRGPRAIVIFFDEVREMKKNLYDDALMISNGMGEDIWWIHFSTPLAASLFEELCNTYQTLTRICYNVTWFSKQNIEDTKKTMSKNKFRQEMLCEFTALDSVCFEGNLYKESYQGQLKQHTYYGTDSNPRNGYTVVGVRYSSDGKHIQIVSAKNFGTHDAGKQAMVKFLEEKLKLHTTYVEHENNGAGMPIGDEIEVKGFANFTAMNWNEKNKFQRVLELQEKHIYFGLDDIEKTENELKTLRSLYSQVSALEFDKSGNSIAKDQSREWHLNDAFIHAPSREDQMSIGAF